MLVKRKTCDACCQQLTICRLLLSANEKELGRLRSAAGEGEEVYKRILECREMAARVRRITTPGSDQSSLLDHLAYMDGWLLHLANELALTGYIRSMLQEVSKGDVTELYGGGHWLSMVMEEQAKLRERMRMARVEA